jgi:hypothetical protein
LWPAGLAGLAVLFVLVERVRGGWAWAAWEREVRAKGERLTVAELTPVAPTNRETRILNAFEAQAALGVRPPADAPGVMRRVAPGKARVTWAAESWIENEGSNSWARLESSLAGLRDQLPAVRAGLTNRAFFIRLDYDQGFDLLLPHLAAEKGLVQALNLGVLDALHRGRLAEAQENLAALTAAVDLSREQPLVISQLVRIACGALAQGAVWEALQADGWTEPELAALQAQWQRLEYLQPLGNALRMERAMARPYYEGKYPLRKLVEIIQAGQVLGGGGGGSRGSLGGGTIEDVLGPLLEAGAACRKVLQVALWRLAWARHDELHAARVIQNWLDEGRQALATRQAPPPVGREGEGGDNPMPGSGASILGANAYDRARFWLSSMTLPGLERTQDKAVLAEGMRDLTVAAIALKRYRLRHGDWPERLDQLVPDYLKGVPTDWFGTGPLKYRRNADGTFLLYSVGKDRRDDGGDAGDPISKNQDRRAKDLVWLQPATAEEVAAFDADSPKRLRRYGLKPETGR